MGKEMPVYGMEKRLIELERFAEEAKNLLDTGIFLGKGDAEKVHKALLNALGLHDALVLMGGNKQLPGEEAVKNNIDNALHIMQQKLEF